MERTTPLRASNDRRQQLARCLKVLQYGFGSRVSRDRLREADNNYQDLIDTGISWADAVPPNAREVKTYILLIRRKTTSPCTVPNLSHSVFLSWKMAGCYYEWQMRSGSQELWIFRRVESEGCILLKSSMLIPGDSTSCKSKPEQESDDRLHCQSSNGCQQLRRISHGRKAYARALPKEVRIFMEALILFFSRSNC